MQRLTWVDRKFHLDIPPGWIHNVMSRLAGTEARLSQITQGLTDLQTHFKPDGKWSIKEHIGHLGDLEDLHLQRLSDFKEHRPQLSAWDVTNAATDSADHNEREINDLVDTFYKKRKRFIELLQTLDDETQMFQSQHPRLKIPMKPVDMATFIAEHDDHHIASMLNIAHWS